MREVLDNMCMGWVERLVETEQMEVPWFDSWSTEYPHLYELIDERLRELMFEWRLETDEIDPELVARTVIKRKWHTAEKETFDT